MFCQNYLTRSVPIIALLLAVSFTTAADAAFVTQISGNTNPGDSGVDGTVNFALLTNNDTLSGDTFGTGFGAFDLTFAPGVFSGAFDLTADYLYLFQVVNNGDNPVAINRFTLTLLAPHTTLSSWGSFSLGAGPTGFKDDNPTDGGFVSATNNFGTDEFDFNDPDPANLGVESPGVGKISDAIIPTFVERTAGVFSATFFVGGSGPTIPDGGRSVIFGFTTNLPPAFTNTAIIDGAGADGTALSPTQGQSIIPEPASLVIWGFGAFGLALFGARRRKTKN